MKTSVCKRFAALLLGASLVFSPSFSFADENFTSLKATELQNLGLFAGTSLTSFTPDLSGALTREAGIVMLLRLFGQESVANEMTDSEVESALSGFSDAAAISAWARNSVAYAVQNGLVAGTSAATLAPMGSLSGNAFSTLLLKQLGYQVPPSSYGQASLLLAQHGGLTATQATAVAMNTTLLRSDLVGISFGALSATTSNGSTLVQQLVTNGVISQTGAANAGFTVTPTTAVVPTTTVSTGSGSGSHHHSDPDAAISGLANLETAVHDIEAVPFTVSPSSAAVSVTCSNTSVIDEYSVTGSGINWTLDFQSATTGSAILTVTAAADGYDTATQNIAVTVLGVLSFGWPDDLTDSLLPTPAGIDLGPVTPYDVDFSFEYDAANGVFDNPQIVDHGMYYSLTVNPLSAGGPVDLTIIISKDGYVTEEHVIEITITP